MSEQIELSLTKRILNGWWRDKVIIYFWGTSVTEMLKKHIYEPSGKRRSKWSAILNSWQKKSLAVQYTRRRWITGSPFATSGGMPWGSIRKCAGSKDCQINGSGKSWKLTWEIWIWTPKKVAAIFRRGGPRIMSSISDEAAYFPESERAFNALKMFFLVTGDSGGGGRSRRRSSWMSFFSAKFFISLQSFDLSWSWGGTDEDTWMQDGNVLFLSLYQLRRAYIRQFPSAIIFCRQKPLSLAMESSSQSLVNSIIAWSLPSSPRECLEQQRKTFLSRPLSFQNLRRRDSGYLAHEMW